MFHFECLIQYWTEFTKVIQLCEQISDTIPLYPLQNTDEIKYFLRPIDPPKFNEPCNIVTLGIGHDVTSEWKLKNILPEHCQFYGVDPSEEQNRRLYEGLRGKFFPIAVADKTHNRTSFLMNCKFTVKHNILLRSPYRFNSQTIWYGFTKVHRALIKFCLAVRNFIATSFNAISHAICSRRKKTFNTSWPYLHSYT
ncbi:unnamed protein product [Anisakis simplex]|uniref:Methyltransferase n=1 Tax=Anisakis simplex TaxID=6269 RepID=A0A0M3J6M0_ANISI|nr:unnamed protein product [Anisakis simplex]